MGEAGEQVDSSIARTGERFVWPPGRPVEVAPPQDSPDLTGAPSESQGEPGGASPARSKWARATAEVERVWLGHAPTPIAQRLVAAVVDAPACWRCGGIVGMYESDADGCATCREQNLAWSRFLRLGVYVGPMRDAIHELKFARSRRAGRELGAMLGKQIAVELDRRGIPPEDALITPMPTTWRRRMSRGIDHALVLARAAGSESGVRVGRLLSRAHRQPQSTLPASEREGNVRATFRTRGRMGCPRVICVVDDVRTTGATMRAACLALGKCRDADGNRINPERLWACVAAVAETRRAGAGDAASDARATT